MKTTALENEYIYKQLSKLSVLTLKFLLPLTEQVNSDRYNWTKSDIINELMDERLLPF